ncbi:hypothetical protein FCV25MIE_25164 [Fagus crenata]
MAMLLPVTVEPLLPGVVVGAPIGVMEMGVVAADGAVGAEEEDGDSSGEVGGEGGGLVDGLSLSGLGAGGFAIDGGDDITEGGVAEGGVEMVDGGVAVGVGGVAVLVGGVAVVVGGIAVVDGGVAVEVDGGLAVGLVVGAFDGA